MILYGSLFWFWFWQIIHSPPRGVSREWGGVALYSAYAADVNLDSSALKDAADDCSTTWDSGTKASSSLLRFEPQKSGGMHVLKNQQHEI